MTDQATIALFSYGTLQLPAVQQEKYGRLIDGEADALPGYRLDRLLIDDEDVVRLSGKGEHPIACKSKDDADSVAGVVLMLTPSELAATDAYEVEPYTRVEVRLKSGRTAFAYVMP